MQRYTPGCLCCSFGSKAWYSAHFLQLLKLFGGRIREGSEWKKKAKRHERSWKEIVHIPINKHHKEVCWLKGMYAAHPCRFMNRWQSCNAHLSTASVGMSLVFSFAPSQEWEFPPSKSKQEQKKNCCIDFICMRTCLGRSMFLLMSVAFSSPFADALKC